MINQLFIHFHEQLCKTWTKERQPKSCRHGGRTQHLGSLLPTPWSGDTLLSLAGTVFHGSWEAHRRPRHHPAPGQNELHGGASGQAGCSYHQYTPTSGHWSQDAHRHEPWTHQKSARQKTSSSVHITLSGISFFDSKIRSRISTCFDIDYIEQSWGLFPESCL